VRSGIGLLRFGARDVPARSWLGRVVLRMVLHHLLRAGDVPRSETRLTTLIVPPFAREEITNGRWMVDDLARTSQSRYFFASMGTEQVTTVPLSPLARISREPPIRLAR